MKRRRTIIEQEEEAGEARRAAASIAEVEAEYARTPRLHQENLELKRRLEEMDRSASAHATRMTALEQELEELKIKHGSLQEVLMKTKETCQVPRFTMEWLLQQDDDTSRAFLGLPKDGVEGLLTFALNLGFPQTMKKFQTPWQDMIFLTLHWLKVDPGFRVLTYTCGIPSLSTVHAIVHATLYALKPLCWEVIRKHPEIFAQRTEELRAEPFKKVKAVGDCTNFPAERPGHHELNKAMFSTYRYAHMAKVFIACDGRGWPVFISSLYASSASDDAIILNHKEEFVKLFEKGEALMYDKGAYVHKHTA